MKRNIFSFSGFDKYRRTDLASEMRARCGACIDADGMDFREEQKGVLTLSRLKIYGEDAAQMLSKPCGNYVTVGFPSPSLMSKEELSSLEDILSREIKDMLEGMCPDLRRVCIAGLGNRDITSDALGPLCASAVEVNRHLKLFPHVFSEVGEVETTAITPGVMGSTGFETASLVGCAADIAKPDAVIAIDALAAASHTRLACTVQLSDTGISPGSGVGNRRSALNRSTLGVPVLALGVPTVVESTALILSSIEELAHKSGKGLAEDRGLRELLGQAEGFFVTPKDIDLSLKLLCPVISGAINKALHGEREQ